MNYKAFLVSLKPFLSMVTKSPIMVVWQLQDPILDENKAPEDDTKILDVNVDLVNK